MKDISDRRPTFTLTFRFIPWYFNAMALERGRRFAVWHRLTSAMAGKSVSITELEQQIEAVRQEAFADGYATAMKEVKELTARPAPDPDGAQKTSGNGRVRRRRSPPAHGLTAGDKTSTNGSESRPRGQATNAVLVREVLKAAAPKGLRAAEIRRALQGKGRTISFTSIGYSLRQLAARNAARQVGNTKTWRHPAN